MTQLPSIVITGASGFIGSYLIDYIKEDFKIFAIARRSRKEANIPYHQNLHWLQCDISNWVTLNEAADYINKQGGTDFVVHLAAFYDFTYKDNTAYKNVNVDGTKNMLDFSALVKTKRFIFASSIAACEFPSYGNVITEKTSPDANYHYAISKKLGEVLVKNYSDRFPCTIVRFAAVYSDWCEFAPLYKFLTSWLSKKLESKIIGGKGESAIPYIHIRDLCQMLKTIIDRTSELLPFDVYNASPNGSISHKEIFEISTRYFFGEMIKPIHLPKLLAYPALVLKRLLKSFKLVCDEPFEQFWMIRYIDKKLEVDSSYTQSVLNWLPTARYHLTRRLLFLLEKLKSHPDEWRVKNEATLKRFARRTNLIIYEKMIEQKEVLLTKISEIIINENPNGIFGRYREMPLNDFQCYMSALYHLLLATIRSSDRSLLLKYIDDIAIRRFAEGFEPNILCGTLKVFSDTIIHHLSAYKELSNIKQELYDNIGLSLQIAQDEVEDLYDNLVKKMPIEMISKSSLLPDCKELQKMIHQLSAFYQVSPEDFNLTSAELQNTLK
ncbi:MAG: NAD-dependent epimerase/dehydratase family protein [Ignavibacteriales bacterium]|nr:NAD-dependent epimerase/dehydratase family protein [Ignavibacteriales bacterium]